ncbi:MAG: zinc ABC transporter substrate-binding protein [Planctomycetia bacterium]|nr:zinc ABC transporter substrate-binding protein [Planctomycetia bacterium]
MSGGRIWLKVACVATVAAILPLFILGCKKDNAATQWPADKTGPKVVVSFAPLYCFAVNVAGDDATVKNVMTTTGPHHFQPTDAEIKLLTQADIFFILGLELDEASATKMKKGSGNENLKLIELGKAIPAEKLCEGKCNHHPDEDIDPDHKHIDHHVWLSPDHAIILVNAIRDELKTADPAHAAGYDDRAAKYVAKLTALKADGLAMLKDKKDRKLISFHDSLAYFEKAYDLKVVDVLTKTPGQEPDAKQMKKLIDRCSKPDDPVRLIAVEPQYSTSNSGESLRKELLNRGVKDPVLVELDPLETVKPDELTADWYERKMRQNLDALAKAMK